MKKEKIFQIKKAEEIFFCKTISAVIDLITEKNWSIKPFQIWKMTKEIGDIHVVDDFELRVLPLFCHENPNKGGYREKRTI